MGIHGLLKTLEPVMAPAHISQYRNQRAAVDASCWLHRSAYCCSMDLVLQQPTTKYLNFCMHYIHMLQSFGIKPVVVFDGANLPMKHDENQLRSDTREKYKEQALELLSQHRVDEAVRYFQRAVSLTPDMVRSFIAVLKEAQVEFVVAPYEADAQISYLYRNGLVDFCISEDSDLLAFGCERVFFKMDRTGNGRAVDLVAIKQQTLTSLEPKDKKCLNHLKSFSALQFLQVCILAGCDYLPSAPGIGLKTAVKYMARYQNMEVVFYHLRRNKNLPEDYPSKFQKALQTFLHQRVYDGDKTEVRFLTALPDQEEKDAGSQSLSQEYHFLGKHIPSTLAVGVAKGLLHPVSLQPYGYLDMPKALLEQIVAARTETKRRKDFFAEMTQPETRPAAATEGFVAAKRQKLPPRPPPTISAAEDIARIQAMYEFETEADAQGSDDDLAPPLTLSQRLMANKGTRESPVRGSVSTERGIGSPSPTKKRQSSVNPFASPTTNTPSRATSTASNPFCIRNAAPKQPPSPGLFSTLLAGKKR